MDILYAKLYLVTPIPSTTACRPSREKRIRLIEGWLNMTAAYSPSRGDLH